jgi:cyclic pyranopterin phosphate synthase
MAQLSHLDEQGRARMVDVSEKEVTSRFATACGTILMRPETLALILDDKIEKGDVFRWPASPASWRRKKLPN